MSDNIATMTDKQLRNKVQMLQDELAIMRRKYEDILYNLDTDNFSSRFVKEQGDMRTAIEVTAKGIEAKVSTEEFESRLTLTAKEFQTALTAVSAQQDILSSSITQTAEDIKMVVSKNISVKFESDYDPNYIDTTDSEKGMLCEYNGELYYYNDITRSWEIYPYADGIKSQFLQTYSGFELTGDVSISGDAIVGGTISGSVWQNSAGKIKLSLGDDYGVYGDLTLVKEKSNGSVSHIFSVVDAVSIVDFKAMDELFMSATGNGGMPTVYAYGTWDFSNCKTTGLEAVAKFG